MTIAPTKKNRKLKDRTPYTGVPIVISDRTSIAVGFEPETFRAFVKQHKIPHVNAGRRILVRVDVLLETIIRLERAGVNVDFDAADTADDLFDDGMDLSSPASVLAAIGRRAS